MQDFKIGPLGLTYTGNVDRDATGTERFRKLAITLNANQLLAYGWDLRLPPDKTWAKDVHEALAGIEIHGIMATGSPYLPEPMRPIIKGRVVRARHALRAIVESHAKNLAIMGAKSITVHSPRWRELHGDTREAKLLDLEDELRAMAEAVQAQGLQLRLANGSYEDAAIADGLELANITKRLGIGATYLVGGEWAMKPRDLSSYEDHVRRVFAALPKPALVVYGNQEMRSGKPHMVRPYTGDHAHATPPLRPTLRALQAHGGTLLIEGGRVEASATQAAHEVRQMAEEVEEARGRQAKEQAKAQAAAERKAAQERKAQERKAKADQARHDREAKRQAAKKGREAAREAAQAKPKAAKKAPAKAKAKPSKPRKR